MVDHHYSSQFAIPCSFHFPSHSLSLSRFGHGSDFSKLASSDQEEQTDYVVGVCQYIFNLCIYFFARSFSPASTLFGNRFCRFHSSYYHSSSSGVQSSCHANAWENTKLGCSRVESESNLTRRGTFVHRRFFGHFDAHLSSSGRACCFFAGHWSVRV
jgi:hypothetical protein